VSDETGETLADAMAESDKMAEDANTKKMLKSVYLATSSPQLPPKQ
jgi:hypothetical protein